MAAPISSIDQPSSSSNPNLIQSWRDFCGIHDKKGDLNFNRTPLTEKIEEVLMAQSNHRQPSPPFMRMTVIVIYQAIQTFLSTSELRAARRRIKVDTQAKGEGNTGTSSFATQLELKSSSSSASRSTCSNHGCESVRSKPILPRQIITEQGYNDLPRLWIDLQGQGVRNDHARYVGPGRDLNGRFRNEVWLSIAFAGSSQQNTLPGEWIFTDRVVPGPYYRGPQIRGSQGGMAVVDTANSAQSPSRSPVPSPSLSIANLILPRQIITEHGYGHLPKFWTDLQGQGAANDYVRYVGPNDEFPFIWLSVALAGANRQGTLPGEFIMAEDGRVGPGPNYIGPLVREDDYYEEKERSGPPSFVHGDVITRIADLKIVIDQLSPNILGTRIKNSLNQSIESYCHSSGIDRDMFDSWIPPSTELSHHISAKARLSLPIFRHPSLPIGISIAIGVISHCLVVSFVSRRHGAPLVRYTPEIHLTDLLRAMDHESYATQLFQAIRFQHWHPFDLLAQFSQRQDYYREHTLSAWYHQPNEFDRILTQTIHGEAKSESNSSVHRTTTGTFTTSTTGGPSNRIRSHIRPMCYYGEASISLFPNRIFHPPSSSTSSPLYHFFSFDLIDGAGCAYSLLCEVRSESQNFLTDGSIWLLPPTHPSSRALHPPIQIGTIQVRYANNSHDPQSVFELSDMILFREWKSPRYNETHFTGVNSFTLCRPSQPPPSSSDTHLDPSHVVPSLYSSLRYEIESLICIGIQVSCIFELESKEELSKLSQYKSMQPQGPLIDDKIYDKIFELLRVSMGDDSTSVPFPTDLIRLIQQYGGSFDLPFIPIHRRN